MGERLALHAKRLVYNKNIVSDGPVADEAAVSEGRLIVRFKHGEGLWAKAGRPMLDVIDHAGNTHRLYARINGEALEAEADGIAIETVRFGWQDCPVVTLYNAHGLPASPFEEKVKR